MPDTPAEQKRPWEEPGTAIVPEYADEQDQETPRGHGGKTFLEHARESMNEHETLGRLPAQ